MKKEFPFHHKHLREDEIFIESDPSDYLHIVELKNDCPYKLTKVRHYLHLFNMYDDIYDAGKRARVPIKNILGSVTIKFLFKYVPKENVSLMTIMTTHLLTKRTYFKGNHFNL